MRSEAKREKLLFLLFCILSFLLHSILLIAFAGNLKFHKMSAQTLENQDAIQVETVNIPPPSPEAPPESLPPTRQPLPRPPETPEPDALVRNQPKPTPTALPTPILNKPSATPLPQASASIKPQVTPSPALPSPSALPNPQASPTQLADLPPAEAQAKKSIQDFMKEQGTEAPETLPQGFTSWEEYQKFLVSFDENAKKFMTLPGHTTGSDQAGHSASSSPPSPGNQADSPNQGEPREGYRTGLLDFWLNNGAQEPGRNRQNFDIGETENKLNSGQERLRDLTRELELPAASAPPLPEKWETGSLGFSYVRFNYDQLRFQARWDAEVQESVREVDVNYYPPTAPKEIQSFKLKWNPAWSTDIKGLISAIQTIYEQKKKGASR